MPPATSPGDAKSHEDTSPEPGKSLKPRRSKACKQCHALKVRCIPVTESDPSSPCVRCINSNKVCEIDNVEPKKKRKKSSKKGQESVAELKEQIFRLQQQLHTLHLNQASATVESYHSSNSPFTPTQATSETQSPPFMTKSDLENELHILNSGSIPLKDISDDIKAYTEMRHEMLHEHDKIDVVSLGIITKEDAELRLYKYQSIIYPSHSFVDIPPHVTVDKLIQEQPFLLNCIMAVTSTVLKKDKNYKLCLSLEKHAIAMVISEIMVSGTKSVELVKCLTLLSIWYNTPELFKMRRYHILNSVAVTLLHDLGIVSRTSFRYSSESKMIEKSDEKYQEMEYRVMVLTLYFCTVSFCLILRRAIFVKWTPYVEECCTMLEESGNEKFQSLALFSRLNHELERINQIVHSPENCKSRMRMSNYTFSELTTRLSITRDHLRDDDHLLLAYFHSVEAYLNQPSIEDLQVKFDGLNCSQDFPFRTLNSISRCTTSCLDSLLEFNKLSAEEVAALPLFHFSRIIYTAGILMRLRYFILSRPSSIEKDLVPKHAIAQVLQLNLKIQSVSELYPVNFLVKKMWLVLRLFVQTYVTQVSELIAKNNNGTQSSMGGMTKGEASEYNNLTDSLLRYSREPLTQTSQPHPLHLELLSFAATAHGKSHEQGMHAEARGDSSQASDPSTAALTTAESLDQGAASNGLQQFPADDKNSLGNLLNEHPVASQETSSGAEALRNIQTQSSLAVPKKFPTHLLPPENAGHAPEPARRLSAGQLMADAGMGDKDSLRELDDEFWSNLLTADSDTLHFAPDNPSQNENFLYNIL